MRILVSVLVNMGDVIIMTSALDIIRKAYPTATIDVLARPESIPVLENNPVLDQVIVYNYRSGSFFHGFQTTRDQIEKGSYDIFLSLDRRFRSAALAYAAGIKIRLGPALLFSQSRPRWWTRFLFTETIPITQEECQGNVIDIFQLIVRRGFDLKGQGVVHLPPVSKEASDWAQQLFKPAQGPVIGLCVRTNHPLKTWPAERFIALMHRLKTEKNAFMYITGDSNDREYVEKMLSTLPANTAMNLAGKTSIMELRALALQSDLFITLDNGAAHLIANSGLSRLICIFGSTEPGTVASSLGKAEAVWSPHEICRPCQKTPAECPKPICLENVSVEQVHQAVQKVLNQERDHPAELEE